MVGGCTERKERYYTRGISSQAVQVREKRCRSGEYWVWGIQTLESKKLQPELASMHRGTLLGDHWTPSVLSVSDDVTSRVFSVSEYATVCLPVSSDVTFWVFL